MAHLDRTLAGPRLLPGGPRWTDPAGWHVTLAFLGEVPDARLDRLVTGVGLALGGSPALRLRLAGAGAFPARGRPRVLWLRVESTVDGVDRKPTVDGVDRKPTIDGVGSGPAGDAGPLLAGAARAVRRAARAAGVEVDRRPFRPHLTIGRWRPADPAPGRAVVDALAGYRGPPFRVSEYVLIRSWLGPAPRYERLRSWPLISAGRA